MVLGDETARLKFSKPGPGPSPLAAGKNAPKGGLRNE